MFFLKKILSLVYCFNCNHPSYFLSDLFYKMTGNKVVFLTRILLSLCLLCVAQGKSVFHMFYGNDRGKVRCMYTRDIGLIK